MKPGTKEYQEFQEAMRNLTDDRKKWIYEFIGADWGNYENNALRTESLINPKTQEPFTVKERETHCIFGLITELGELLDTYKKHIYYGKPLDTVNIQEEIGDIFWYVAIGSAISRPNADLNSMFIVGKYNDIDLVYMSEIVPAKCTTPYLIQCILQILTQFTVAKKVGFFAHLSQVVHYMQIIVFMLGVPLQQILDVNINKLRVRYPEKFDSGKAVNRNLFDERKELEKI